MALIFNAVAHINDDPAAHLRSADETLALDPVAGPSAALPATRPRVRRGLTDETYVPIGARDDVA